MEDNKQYEVEAEITVSETTEAEKTAPVAKVSDTAPLSFFGKIKRFFKNVNWKTVYDKTTTGILIFLLSSPLLILLYIFLWFILK